MGNSADGFQRVEHIYTVSELNRLARLALEGGLPLAWVTGEISNLTLAASGHVYFSLKDEAAQVRCVMWRNRAQLLPFRLANGMHVDARALATLYEPRGDFQLAVETLRHAGIGALYEAYARLKARLQAAGLFDAQRKKPLPPYPQRIGIVTSPQAAALRDVLVALGRRAPQLPVILYPAPVQGEGAGAQLAAALRLAAARKECDVLILCRGGGGIEDLWAFNDESLALAIAASPVPVVTGIGHETDSTIADFVADLRAATPTAAAELVSAAWLDAKQRLTQLAPQFARAMQRQLMNLAQRSDLAARRLVHPRERIRRLARDLAGPRARLVAAMRRRLEQADERSARLALRLVAARPRPATLAQRLDAASQRLTAVAQRMLADRGQRLAALEAHLRHLDPQQTLARGYAIVRDDAGEIVRDAFRLQPGSAIRIRFARGGAQASVTGVEHAPAIVSPPLSD